MEVPAYVHGKRPLQILLLGVLLSCTGAVGAQSCDPTPYLAGVGLTDLNRVPVFSISAGTEYFVKVCARSASVCITLTGGGQLVGRLSPTTACNDVSFPSPYTRGDVGETYFRVQPTGPGTPLTGQVTPWDACSGAQPQFNMNFALPGGSSCSASTRRYVCGYALPGYGCNNGRISRLLNVSSMRAAIAACPTVQPSGYSDFCYVIARDGATASDISECTAAAGSWRPGNNCCNFRGTLSCPQ